MEGNGHIINASPEYNPHKALSYLRAGDIEVPLHLIYERRRSVRASINKSGVMIRLPLHLSPTERAEYIDHFSLWALKQFQLQPDYLISFKKRVYHNGQTLILLGRRFTLQLTFGPQAHNKASVRGDIVHLLISSASSKEQLDQEIPDLLSKLFARVFQPVVEQRLRQLNDRYFQKPLKKVTLKHNHTVWGSCSGKGNINISTRLLFAPLDVADYVLIHELAHLVELNHSDRFWKLVADCMPDYEQKESWLKKNNALCNF